MSLQSRFKFFFFITLTLSLQSGGLFAEIVKHECTVFAYVPMPGGTVEKRPVTAEMSVRHSESDDGETSVILEVNAPGGTRILKAVRDLFPSDVQALFPERRFFHFLTPRSMHPQKLVMDLRDPAPPRGQTRAPERIRILDAWGNPAEGFDVLSVPAFFMTGRRPVDIVMEPETLDASGEYRLFPPQTVYRPWELGTARSEARAGVLAFIRHPETGQMEKVMLPPFHESVGSAVQSDTLYLSSVKPPPRENEQPDNIYPGKVVDENGFPVQGARILLRDICLPGGETKPMSGETNTIITGQSGEFQLAVPRNVLMEKLGIEKSPRPFEIFVTVTPPQEQESRFSVSLRLVPGKKETIALPMGKELAFRFRNPDGRLLDPEKMANLEIFALSELTTGALATKKPIELVKEYRDQETLLVRPMTIPGIYYIKCRRYEFLPRKLNLDAIGRATDWIPAPAPLEKTAVTYSGKAVDAASGSPVPGALVFLSRNSSICEYLYGMEQADREKILSSIDSGGILIPPEGGQFTFDNDRRYFKVLAAGKTDASGQFLFREEPAWESWHIIVWAPSYVGLQGNRRTLRKRGKDQCSRFLLPDAMLMPAARVEAKIGAPYILPDPRLREEVERDIASASLSQISLDFKTPGSWSLDPNRDSPRHARTWSPCLRVSPLELDKPFHAMVPADAPFSLKIISGRDPVIKGASWDVSEPLEKGETRNLGEKELELNQPFLLKVSNPDGSPAAGASVRISGRETQLTDEAGTTIGWAGDETVRIEVMESKNSPSYRKTIEIPDNPRDQILELEIQLGEEDQ